MSKIHASVLLVPILLGSSMAYAVTLGPLNAALTVTYTLPNTAGSQVVDNFTPTNTSTFVYVVTSTVPSWLNVTTSGTGGGTVAIPFDFQANAVAATMEPGTYNATVNFTTTNTAVYGTTPVSIAVTLAVKAAPPKFAVSETGNGILSWSPGSSTYPTMNITVSSSGEEIAYTVAAGGSIGSSMTITPTSGIAYPWGSTIAVTFSPQIFLTATVGSNLTGTVTLTPNNGAAPVVINVNINVAEPALALTSVSPVEVPVDKAADHTVVITGVGFTPGLTTVAVTISATTTTVAPDHMVIASPTSIIVTLDHSTFLAAAATLTFTAANGTTAATGTPNTVGVTTKPIIYAITSSASYVEPATPTTNPQVSPFELISIFGANFDPANGLAVNTVNSTEPFLFMPTMNNSDKQALAVNFYPGVVLSGDISADNPVPAPLIFVSNNQINAIVPSGLTVGAGGYNLTVSVATVLNDVVVPIDVLAATPGIFTPSGTGEGIAAVLQYDPVNLIWTLNSATNPAKKGWTISIYATGLGVPAAGSAAADEYIASPGAYPASCLTTADYIAVINGTTGAFIPNPSTPTLEGTALASNADTSLLTMDGAVIQSSWIYPGLLPPCFALSSSGVQVKLNNPATTALTTTYAGFVSGSVAGLYQINAVLPATAAGYTQTLAASGSAVPLSIYANSVASQPGVVVWVE